MTYNKLINLFSLTFVFVNTMVIQDENSFNLIKDISKINNTEIIGDNESIFHLSDLFDGVYTECFLYLSYTCLQKKTLLYLEHLNNLDEVSIIGNYMKFVKVNASLKTDNATDELKKIDTSEELSHKVDQAIDSFFDNHVLTVNALGRQITVPRKVEEFVGRKRRKGGGGGGHGGGHGGDDGGKKKMMMMAMMCMKMKFMMMVPAMMGMLGMMSFKGMMFSMMSFMVSKMMLLMKLLEKKGGGNGGGDGGAWNANGSGGGGTWMPAGGQDFSSGGGSGGYDANGQWQSRSIIDKFSEQDSKVNTITKPVISYITPAVRHGNNVSEKKSFALIKDFYNKVPNTKDSDIDKPKSRNKRSIIDILQNTYMYWMNKVLGINNKNKIYSSIPKYKIINGVKYVYYPNRLVFRPKSPKLLDSTQHFKTTEEMTKLRHNHLIDNNHDFKPIITADDFNKGEIVEGPVESRMNRRKFSKVKQEVHDVLDENPWQ